MLRILRSESTRSPRIRFAPVVLTFLCLGIGCLGSENPRATVPDRAGGAPTTGGVPDDGGASALGGTSSSLGGAGDVGPRGGGFGLVVGLDPGGRARRVGDDFYATGQTLLSNADGTSWLLWRSYSNPDFSEHALHLDQFDTDGVLVQSSALGAQDPDGVVLHEDGTLTAFHNHCGPTQMDTCFYRGTHSGEITECVWPAFRRTVTRYELDTDGNLAARSQVDFDQHFLAGAAPRGNGLYAVTRHGSYFIQRFDDLCVPLESVELFPAVVAPDMSSDAPTEVIVRAADLARQVVTDPVVVDDGVVIGATVTRGTLAALADARGVDLTLPDDPACPDVVVAHLKHGGQQARYFSIRTPECESLPKLSVVSNHAVVATSVLISKTPEPNDTSQYDIGLAIVDLASGSWLNRVFSFEEDNLVRSIAPCGTDRVCLSGVTGTRSVDTGSRVTFGNGFVLPVSLAGEPEALWLLKSPRHSEIQHLATRADGLLFFATVNGPITHSADNDPWLGFNEALLGLIEGI